MKKISLSFSVILLLNTGIAIAQTVNFSQENEVQNWTVPAGITTATVTVTGAAGGGCAGQGAGGNGASVTGICTVIPGHKLSIVVGQTGFNDASWGSGGGGGSYVYDSNTGTLLIVGAGGGGGPSDPTINGGAGGTDILTNATTAGQNGSGAGGTNGNGGSPETASNNDAGGGAGWISNGGNGTQIITCYGGSDRANLFAGGISSGYGSGPGFGGYGGGGCGGSEGGGGGGGYNGGGGGGEDGSGGGGGGSYLNGTVVGTPTANNTGNGSVSIKYGVTGINDLIVSSDQVDIYPNPSNGIFTVEVKSEALRTNSIIEVYNMMGQQVYSQLFPKGSIGTTFHFPLSIDLSNNASGIYMLRILNTDGTLLSLKKIIKS